MRSVDRNEDQDDTTVRTIQIEEEEEDTVEEDIGDFSVCQERMLMQSQIKC